MSAGAGFVTAFVVLILLCAIGLATLGKGPPDGD